MSKAKHTPLDWHYHYNNSLNEAEIHCDYKLPHNHYIIATCHLHTEIDEATVRANANYIVKACNNYPEMVELLKQLTVRVGILSEYPVLTSSMKLGERLAEKARAMLAELEE